MRPRPASVVTVLRGGKVVERVPLVTAAQVEGAGPLRVLVHKLGLPLTLLLAVVIVALVSMTGSLIRRRRRERDRADRRHARATAEATADGPPPTT